MAADPRGIPIDPPVGLPVGMVFRRLDADGDRRRAARLLPRCGLADHGPTCVWYGLCDLTSGEGDELAGVAVVRRLERTAARLCLLAVAGADRGGSLRQRLVCEVADRLRASGVEEIGVPPALGSRVPAFLAQVGFVPYDEPGSGWLRLQL